MSEARGLLNTLRKLKVNIEGVSFQSYTVRTFVGPIEIQKTVAGRPADYQAYLDYAEQGGNKPALESMMPFEAASACSINDQEAPAFAIKFHCSVVDTIHGLAGKLCSMHKSI